jgi:hypothetical protein
MNKITDMHGAEINEGSILNICFTVGDGEHLTDGVYIARRGILGGLEFYFSGLLWESYGYNQYPTSCTLCEKYGSLSAVYDNNKYNLIAITEEGYTAAPHQNYPFNNEKVLSFSSRYFEVIGSVDKNPELLNTDIGKE